MSHFRDQDGINKILYTFTSIAIGKCSLIEDKYI